MDLGDKDIAYTIANAVVQVDPDNTFRQLKRVSKVYYNACKKVLKTIIIYRKGGKEIRTIQTKLPNGFLHGPVYKYRWEGVIFKKENYRNNILNGIQKTYYPNGKLFLEEIYLYGEKHGKEIQYYEDGRIKRLRDWYFDYLISENGVHPESQPPRKKIEF
jgi:antitoxin component YwqK of YwqJK toxin-antitoxin module